MQCISLINTAAVNSFWIHFGIFKCGVSRGDFCVRLWFPFLTQWELWYLLLLLECEIASLFPLIWGPRAFIDPDRPLQQIIKENSWSGFNRTDSHISILRALKIWSRRRDKLGRKPTWRDDIFIHSDHRQSINWSRRYILALVPFLPNGNRKHHPNSP